MDIGVIGSYGGASIGDEAILNGLLLALNEVCDDNNLSIRIFTSNVRNTSSAVDFKNLGSKICVINWTTGEDDLEKTQITTSENFAVKKKFGRNLYDFILKKFPSGSLFLEKYYRRTSGKYIIKPGLFENIDTLIFGGGQILMDLFPKWILILNELINEARKYKVKVYFMGVGAGPIDYFYSKKIIERIVSEYYVSTRDANSSSLLEKMYNKKIFINTDLAFGLFQEKKEIMEREAVGVSVIPYHSRYIRNIANRNEDSYENYKINAAKIFDNFIDKSKEHLIFFATNFPTDIRAAKEIISLMNNKTKASIINNRLSVDQLLDFCKSRQFIIGTRLHSLILSSCAGTDFYALNYQPKVNAFLEKINKKDHYIDINKLCQRELTSDEIEKISENIYQVYLDRNGSKISSFAKKEKHKLLEELRQLIYLS